MSTREAIATCALCEAMCGIRVTLEDGRPTGVRGDADDPFSRGHICPKATAMVDLQHDPDRIRHPLRRTDRGFVRVGWDDALDEIAERVHAIQLAHGNDSVAAYMGNPNAHNLGSMLSGSTFLRTLRTRNKFSATSLDQLPHMLAASLMFGHELLLPIPDLDRTDLLFVIGGNPAVSNGSILTAPDVRRRLQAIADRGTLVVIDPRRTETAALATEHAAIRPGTDGWLLLGLLRAVLDETPPRLGPLAAHTRGIDAIQHIAQRVDLGRVSRETTIPVSTLRRWAQALLDTPRAALYGRLGMCAQAQGGLAGWLELVVNAVTGHLDAEGGMMVTEPAADILFPPGTPRKPRR
ncbi:MAG: molybdopterin-dependent oxidoreductase, partial [Myxococcota bacterium]